MAKYVYGKTTLTKKQIIGVYDAEVGTITTEDQETYSVKDELKDFDGNEITLAVRVKDEEDLAD